MNLIRKPSEIVGRKTISCLIYGQSGTGKTTLACSAPAPVLLDFDGGVARINDAFMVDTVQISNWNDALAALDEIAGVSSNYRTIIIDTASKMIDAIIAHICCGAVPTMRQWGQVNAEFKAYMRRISTLGLNVILTAQREVEKDGEATRYVPQFRASNYKDVVCDLDCVAYLEMVNYQGEVCRQLTFNPSPRNEGKNTAGFEPAYIVKTLNAGQQNDMMSRLFGIFAHAAQERDKRRAELAETVEKHAADWMQIIAEANSAEELNDLVENSLRKLVPLGDLKPRLSRAVADRAVEIGCTYNKEAKKYE